MNEQGSADSPPLASSPGKVLIAPAVLAQIVERSTMGVPGVAAMCSRHPRFDRLRGRALGEHQPPNGVHVRVADDTVNAEIAIVARADANIFELGRQIQREVGEALEHMVGMAVGEINVYVDDVRASG
ncbi:MAG TPA: Asp23/Gls24 family envelope stress response protein [Thermomicrobiales bacterium]|jgi:uncharacterized alkaline shock family protein YloU